MSEHITKADALLKSVATEDMSIDLQSLVASYRARLEAEDERAATAFARAIVRRADREGLSPVAAMTVKELEAEIATRNEGRDDADKIQPASRKKADLQAALDADDAARS